jgi:hypothetical protein
MSMETEAAAQWFYEENGQRKGGVPESELIRLIQEGRVTYGSAVWKKGFPDWMHVENTVLKSYLEDVAPPPLTGAQVDNTVVWVLAFAPLIGLCLEYALAYAMYDDEFTVNVAVASNKFFFVTLALNIALSFLDEKRLEKAGHNTTKFKGWVWLVPVYLYQRAQNLKHNQAYFITWIVCFVLTLI